MIFWTIIGLIAIASCIIFSVLFLIDRSYSDWKWIVSFVSGGAAIMISIISLTLFLEYHDFTIEHEIQREFYESISASSENEVLKVVSILESNKQLAEYMAEKKVYGFLSVVPKSVFDIEPIGIE